MWCALDDGEYLNADMPQQLKGWRRTVRHHGTMAHSSREGRPHAPRRPRHFGETGVVDTSGKNENRNTSTPVGRTPLRQGQNGGAMRRERRMSGPSVPRKRPAASTSEKNKAEETRAQRIKEGKSFTLGGLEISVRFLAVALLMGLLAALLVPNVYALWRQERELAEITAKVAAAQERNAQMQEQLDLWNDPEYIASQARERLGYVKPGETQYTVVDPGKDYKDQAQIGAAPEKGPARPWVQVAAILLKEADSRDSSAPGAHPESSEAQVGSDAQSSH